MGGYYKIKKILLILIICLTILRIFKTSGVFATEATEVTTIWNDGEYTYQADNQILTLRQNQIDIQDALINWFYQRYQDESIRPTAKSILNIIKNNIMTSTWGGEDTHFVWFGRVTTTINDSDEYGYFFQVTRASLMTNIYYADATLNNGYKLLSVPFYSHSITTGNSRRYINVSDATVYQLTSGTTTMPVAEVGCYSTRWLDLWKQYDLIYNSADYEDAFAELQETSDLNYSVNYYTKEAVQNTYSYLTNDTIDEVSSLGISQPEVTEQVDLTDVFDSLEALLTNETYSTKFFTITLPNGSGSTFALSPELLENNLTRVGGDNIISIIHACWYIGLYGWYIFALLGIYGKLLTGDLFHLVKGCSPVTNLVKMSVGTISGGKF